ncbi:MAG: Trm112 family protein [Promethearchaeia archaeon]
MKRWLMEILVCPIEDCRSSLNLEVFESHTHQTDDGMVEEIDAALIMCPNCGRWYPVIDGIPCMLPDNLRKEKKQMKEETTFLEKWKEDISTRILADGIPFGLEMD